MFMCQLSVVENIVKTQASFIGHLWTFTFFLCVCERGRETERESLCVQSVFSRICVGG